MADAAPPPGHSNIVQALRIAADRVEQQLAQASGLQSDQVEVLMVVATHQPTTIPDVATGVGRGYRWALAALADLQQAGLVVRWPSNPGRYTLSDAGAHVVEQMNTAVWDTIVAAHGWPAAAIAGKVLDRLREPFDEAAPIPIPAAPPRLSKASIAAQLLGVEPRVIEAWIRSGALRPPPWTEEDLGSMSGLRDSVVAVWPVLLEGARAGLKLADLATRLGITTQKVASAIGRDPALRSELDEALMEGRDLGIQHA